MDKAENNIATIQAAAATPQNTGAAKDDPQPPVGLAIPLVEPPHKHHKRSPGLRLFDLVLYPVIANVGVFAISVVATYLTTRGGDKDAAGKLMYGKTGEFFHKRGKWLVEKFEGMGMKPETADMSKMVFFSFADGSVMAPLIKLFEDRREKIGRWCDKKLGTTPSDPNAYAEEPKQSWTSVLGGRAATAAVVVNTAVALNKTGLNDKLFINPGIKMGELMKTKPEIKKFFGKYDVGELAKVSIFEAFYTSVCTAGLYFSSRFFARKLNEHKEKKFEKQLVQHEKAGTLVVEKTAEVETPAITSTAPFARESLRKPRVEAMTASHLERYETNKQEPALSR